MISPDLIGIGVFYSLAVTALRSSGFGSTVLLVLDDNL